MLVVYLCHKIPHPSCYTSHVYALFRQSDLTFCNMRGYVTLCGRHFPEYKKHARCATKINRPNFETFFDRKMYFNTTFRLQVFVEMIMVEDCRLSRLDDQNVAIFIQSSILIKTTCVFCPHVIIAAYVWMFLFECVQYNL